jgi:SAM-dependent methyltransferase
MFSDGTLRKGNLKKVLCLNCGLAYFVDTLSNEDMYDFYSEHYELNTGEDEEHYYIRDGSVIARSKVIYDEWLKNALPWNDIEKFLEVGCGKGSLLNVIARTHPHVDLNGIEANIEACGIARSRGLKVEHGFLDENYSPDFRFDAVGAIGVIEHVMDPISFVGHMARLVKPGGYILIACPDSTSFSYDIYFADHLFHLTPDHLKWLLWTNNCGITLEILNNRLLPNFQCIVARKGDKAAESVNRGIPNTTRCDKAVVFYEKAFNFIDNQLVDADPGKMAAYGGNEVLALFMANTKLSHYISLVLDDRPKGEVRLGLPVSRPADTPLEHFRSLILTLNEEYYGAVLRNLQQLGYSGKIILPLRQEIIELN